MSYDLLSGSRRESQPEILTGSNVTIESSRSRHPRRPGRILLPEVVEGMSMSDLGSTVPRRQVGRLMRQLREQAGISLMAAAQELEFSRARMYRIENGEVPVRKHDVIAMCTVYQATERMTEV